MTVPSNRRSARVRHQIAWDTSAPDHGRARNRIAFLRDYEITRRMTDTLRSPDLSKVLRAGSKALETGTPWAGQPWATPILGSGPLGLPSSFLAVSSMLHKALALKLRDHPVLAMSEGVGADPILWLESFAHTMIEQRVGDDRAEKRARSQTSESADDEYAAQLPGTAEELAPLISEFAALLVLISAQLTRTFHRISLDTCRPISRWGSEMSAMPAQHDRRNALKDEYTTIVRDACDYATGLIEVELGREHPPSVQTLAGIKALLGHVTSDVTNQRVTIAHLQQITEVAWHMLVDSISQDTYPGWTDLMLRLVLSGPDWMAEGYKRPPWAETAKVGAQIREIVEPAAKWSWQHARATPDGRENRDFYDSVAKVLWAQVSAREKWKEAHNGPVDLPQPIAFVTSFDNELEMALWRTAPQGFRDDDPPAFSVILPVYAAESDDARQADFIWLEGVINVNQRESQSIAEFNDVRRVTEWRIVSNKKTKYYRHPVVVRLAGCPLIDLPDVSQIDAYPTLRKELNEAQLGATTRFVHSVTVDEYLAMRQLEAEWIWSRDNEQGSPSGGLPREYIDAKAASRYWMIMGVPLRDPAVRLRVLSVLAQQSRRTYSPAINTADDDRVTVDASDASYSPPAARAVGVGTRARFGKGARESPSASPELPALSPAYPPQPEVGFQLPANAGEEEEEADVTRRGMAINTRVDDEETILLHALGIDVVTDRCEAFSADLLGHAIWLEQTSGRVVAALEAHQRGQRP